MAQVDIISQAAILSISIIRERDNRNVHTRS